MHWFVYYVLPSLITSATSIFIFNTIQTSLIRAESARQTRQLTGMTAQLTAAQTAELKGEIVERVPDGAGSGDRGTGSDPAQPA
jgi:hypothetical protein